MAAFERTAEYDAAISHYLATAGEVLPSDLPGALTLTLPLAKRCATAPIRRNARRSIWTAANRLPEQLHGKALSYNNLLDLDAHAAPALARAARRRHSAASANASCARRS